MEKISQPTFNLILLNLYIIIGLNDEQKLSKRNLLLPLQEQRNI